MLKTRVVAARAWIVPATMAPICLLLLASWARAEGDQMPSEISRRPLPPAATAQAAAVAATGKEASDGAPVASTKNRSKTSEAAAGERDAEGSGKSAVRESGGSAAAPVQAPVPASESKSSNPAAGQSAAAPADPIVAAIRERLSSKSYSREAESDDANALVAYYAQPSAAPLWVTPSGYAPKADSAMAAIRKAGEWGLTAADFELLGPLTTGASPQTLAEAEITLSLAALKYARNARGGRVNPASLSAFLDQKPPVRDPKAVLSELVSVNDAGAYLEGLHPRHEQFRRLREALLKQRNAAGADVKPESGQVSVKLPDKGPTLKPHITHPNVAVLRKRLGVAAQDGKENVYDDRLVDAVKAWQREQGLEGDGIVARSTRQALNGERKGQRASGDDKLESRILLNMERWRWMPEELGDFYVWNNVPDYQTRVMRKGSLIHQEKIIVGKTDTQTPVFSAKMKYVVFNPNWGVPDSIKVKEILPYLRKTEAGFFGDGGETDTRVLQRHNLKVTYNGKPVDPAKVDFAKVDIRNFMFVQPGGGGNVLGVVKFRFPNKHDVYMHDTPQRGLFAKSVRTFSHGCMRVQNPRRLAEILLAEDKSWDGAKVSQLLAGGVNNEVALDRSVPVHVTYFTALADEAGNVKTFPDVYGHDKRLAAALAGNALPYHSAPEVTQITADSRPLRVQRVVRRAPVKKLGSDPVASFFAGLFGN